jgi:signal transduction histidine kinase
MSIQDTLSLIRPGIQKRAANALARGAGVRQTFNSQLAKFFDLLDEALVSGDASWLDSLLRDWVTARTQTDRAIGERNVTNLLNQVILLTFEAAREDLSESDALELIGVLTPIFMHCVERVTTYEHQGQIEYLSEEVRGLQGKLERIERTKSNFISVAAHEFKTPLTLIEGYTAMVDELLPANMQQIRQLVQGVRNGIRRLRAIVDDMIDVSLIDNGLLDLNLQPVWMNRILNLLKAEFNPILTDRRQTLQLEPFGGSEELIFADPARVYQAVHNVLANAIKYTPDGGLITVNGRVLPGFVEVTVTDTGIGIAPENMDAIFEKFGQLGSVSLHSSGKTKFKGGGPGLGLAISKGIIEAHNGSLWVESPGYDERACPGSTFHILLPLRSRPRDPQLAKMFDGNQYAVQPPIEMNQE